MKLKEFLSLLAATTKSYKWKTIAYPSGVTRLRAVKKDPSLAIGYYYCPLVCVANNELGTSYNDDNYEQAGKNLGLSEKTWVRIANGADDEEQFNRMWKLLTNTILKGDSSNES